MAEGMLTQEEIDALLTGSAFDDSGSPSAAKAASAPKPSSGGGGSLSADQLKDLGERLKSAMASAAEVTSTLLGRAMKLAPVSIDMEDDAGVAGGIPSDPIEFDFSISGAAGGSAALVLSKSEVALIGAILMGTESEIPDEIDDLHESSAKEALKHFANGFASAISREAMISVQAGDVAMGRNAARTPPLSGHGNRVLAQFSLEIEGRGETALGLVLDSALALTLAGGAAASAGPPPPRTSSSSTPAPTPRGGSVSVQGVQFPVLNPTLTETQSKNIEILMDVPMKVTVELGRATMMIKDVLDLGTGSIIELDKLAGEPADLLVNQKLIARGEVVVIDESFGVRVTDIITPIERLKGIQ